MKLLIILLTIFTGCAHYPGHPPCADKPALCWYDFTDPETGARCKAEKITNMPDGQVHTEFKCE